MEIFASQGFYIARIYCQLGDIYKDIIDRMKTEIGRFFCLFDGCALRLEDNFIRI